MREFRDACDTLNFDTGLEQFNNFKLCLYLYAKNEWLLLIQGVPLTVAQFNICLRNFVLGFMSSDTKQILVDYLLDLKKPCAMDVRTFASRLQMINRYICFLPGDNVEEFLNLEQIKTVIYKSVPKEWRADFIKANMKLATIKLTALIEYMENKRGLYDPTPDKSGGGNKSGRGNDNNGNAGNNNNGNWNNKRKKNQGRGSQ